MPVITAIVAPPSILSNNIRVYNYEIYTHLGPACDRYNGIIEKSVFIVRTYTHSLLYTDQCRLGMNRDSTKVEDR